MGQKIINIACEYGHLEIVKKVLLDTKEASSIDSSAIYEAAGNGHLEVVKVLIDAKAPIDSSAIYWAAHDGHLEVVKFLLNAKAPIDTAALYWAAGNGHLEVVKVLINAKAPIDINTIYWAARNGHLEVVKVLIGAKALITTHTIYGAPSYGRLEVVKKVLIDAKEVPSIDAAIIYYAAKNGHLDIVKVLIDAKAPIDKSTINWITNETIKKLLTDYYNKMRGI